MVTTEERQGMAGVLDELETWAMAQIEVIDKGTTLDASTVIQLLDMLQRVNALRSVYPGIA